MHLGHVVLSTVYCLPLSPQRLRRRLKMNIHFTVSVVGVYSLNLATRRICMSTTVFAVVRCPSVRLSRWWIVSRRLKKSSDFLFGPVGPSLYSFLDPCADTKFQGEPRQRGLIIHRGRKIGDFRLKSPFISETVRNRPMRGYYTER